MRSRVKTQIRVDNYAPGQPSVATANWGLTNHVGDCVQTRDPLDILVADTGGTEDGWGIDSYTSDANPLLHYLEPDDELDTTTNVEFARTSTGEHRPI